jgi:thiol:disulfide interchange protein DsbD
VLTSYRSIIPARLLLLLAALLAPAATAAPVQQPHSQAELIAERTAVTPGQPLAVALRLQLEKGWHSYWKNPGDAGMATALGWTLPPGFSAGPIQWPAPLRIDTGPLTSYGYEGDVLHLVEITVPPGLRPGDSVVLKAKADWLVCKEVCLPAAAELTLDLPVSAQPASADARWTSAFAGARAALPAAAPAEGMAAYRNGDELIIRVASHAAPGLRALAFFPEREGVIQYAAPQRIERQAEGLDLRLVAAKPGGGERVQGVLVADPGIGAARAVQVELPLQPGPPPSVAPTGTPALALAAAVVLAFGGGLLLNLMPCVFPVLAIKVLGVAQQAHGRAALRMHGLLFAAGVLLSFWIVAGVLLALRAQGAALGWGYQLQSPLVVGTLALLFFVLGLNLSGVFHVGRGIQVVAGSARLRNPHLDALLSGALATAIASPCTAPFMGAALGFALVQPAFDALLVFTALALGMALPYVALTFVPQLTRRLPRPGPWMDTLKQVLAFPLYATVVWLLWVFGQQVGVDGLARLLFALLLVAAGLWAYARGGAARSPVRAAVRVLSAVILASGIAVAWDGTRQEPPPTAAAAPGAWKPWSESAVQEVLAQGRPAFVDFTAAWCVTCQVNKRLVLHADEVERRFEQLNVARLRADWTNQDPAITRTLARLQRSGVPVYALYLPQQREPQLLPEVLTRRIVLDALERSAQGTSLSSATIEERP